MRRSWLPDPVDTAPAPVPFTLPESTARSYRSMLATGAVLAAVVALVVVMATSASILGREGTTREPVDRGTPVNTTTGNEDATSPTEPPTTEATSGTSETSTIEPSATSTTVVPDDLSDAAIPLRSSTEVVGPALGPGWRSDEGVEVEPGAVPPTGAGCGSGQGNVTPSAAYERSWSLPGSGTAADPKVVVRMASFDRAEDLAADLAAEAAIPSAVCAEAALNALRPGTDVSVAEPLPTEFSVDPAAYRMISVDQAGQVEAVTDIFVVGVGLHQATMTVSHCCEPWDLAGEHTVLAALLVEMSEAQGLPVDGQVAMVAQGPVLVP